MWTHLICKQKEASMMRRAPNCKAICYSFYDACSFNGDHSSKQNSNTGKELVEDIIPNVKKKAIS